MFDFLFDFYCSVNSIDSFAHYFSPPIINFKASLFFNE
nr:MAG TPA: hypothetical protein [Caudoviricetes sp.]